MKRTSENPKKVKPSPWRGKVIANLLKELPADEEDTNDIEATKKPEGKIYPMEEKRISLSKELIDIFLEQSDPIDVMGLYIFYRQTVLWQKTDQVRATDDFCMKGLKLGRVRFDRAKKVLKNLGLIRQVVKGRTINNFGKYYIKVNYIVRSVVFRRTQENKALATELDKHTVENKRSSDYRSSENGTETLKECLQKNPLKEKKNEPACAVHSKKLNNNTPKGTCPRKYKFGIDNEEHPACNTCEVKKECYQKRISISNNKSERVIQRRKEEIEKSARNKARYNYYLKTYGLYSEDDDGTGYYLADNGSYHTKKGSPLPSINDLKKIK